MKDSLYRYGIVAYDVYDGDTTKVVLDLGHNIPLGHVNNPRTWYSVRIFGVDTPEKRSRRQKEAGLLVTDVVKKLLKEKEDDMVVHSISLGKYAGRFIGDFLWEGGSLSGFLLENGLAKKYAGKKKEPWTDEELAEIIDRCNGILDTEEEAPIEEPPEEMEEDNND
jgi:endonuclease YncB( thermonuclease family)